MNYIFDGDIFEYPDIIGIEPIIIKELMSVLKMIPDYQNDKSINYQFVTDLLLEAFELLDLRNFRF